MTEQSAAINGEVRRIMDVIASRMRLDSLPMNRPDINFFRAARSILQKWFRGQDLEDATYDVLGKIALQTEPVEGRPVTEGSLFSYPGYVERKEAEGETPMAFDRFFLMNVDQKGRQMKQRRHRSRNQDGLSIGRSEEHGGISEELLPGGESAFDEAARADELAKRERVFAGIPKFLADQRYGNILVQIWDMTRQGYTHQEMVDKFIKDGVPTITEGEEKKVKAEAGWNVGKVSRQKMKIMNLVKQYLQIKGINWDSV